VFLEEASSSLMQGDLSVIPALPVWQVGATNLTRSGTEELLSMQLPVAKTLRAKGHDGHLVMVCSHSCDLENPRIRSGLLVAPVVKVPASEQREAERWRQIVESHSPDDKNQINYVQFFPVELPKSLGESWGVVDFSALISMGKAVTAAEMLLQGKVAELDSAFRIKLQTKLALFVGAPDRAAGE
jgi:hypothetical protein